MRFRLSLPVALCLLPATSACSFMSGVTLAGSGVSETDERQVDTFSEVESLGSIDLSIRVGEQIAVVVRGDDNLLEHIITDVSGDRLTVSMKNGSYSTNAPLEVDITLPALTELELIGSGDAQIQGLRGGDLTLVVQGSGDVVATGQVEHLQARISGSGDMALRELRAQTVHAKVHGSGDMEVHAEEKLTASVHGSGEIDYWGDPKERDVDSFGAGDVRGH